MTDDDDDAPITPGALPVEQFTSLRAALSDALTDAPHLRRDRAMIALAFRYADLVDGTADRIEEADDEDQAREFARMVATIAKIGPRLEAVLTALGMAPGARPALRGGEPHGQSDPAAVALERLQRESDNAAAGIVAAPAVDPAVAEALAGE